MGAILVPLVYAVMPLSATLLKDVISKKYFQFECQGRSTSG